MILFPDLTRMYFLAGLVTMTTLLAAAVLDEQYRRYLIYIRLIKITIIILLLITTLFTAVVKYEQYRRYFIFIRLIEIILSNAIFFSLLSILLSIFQYHTILLLLLILLLVTVMHT